MTELPIYLDYQATTPLDPRVAKAMEPYWASLYGNPHSRDHRFGWDAAAGVELARSQVASLIGAYDDEIIFVSGATESCNLALRRCLQPEDERNQIITLATEHPAVLETVRWLGKHGFDATVLPVMSNGLLDLSVLAEELSERTLMVSVMLANNEIGVIQPLAEIARMAHAVGAVVHTDATQAVGRTRVNVDELDVDLLSMSSHKIYGPNGIGALYMRNGVRLDMAPIMTGGSQERGLRPGTVPAPLAVGFGKACQILISELESDIKHMACLANQLKVELIADIPSVKIFGDPIQRIPGSLNAGVPGVLSERLVEAVSDSVAISTGAACSTGSPQPSHVLLALGIGEEIAATATRISLGRFTTGEEINVSSEVLRSAWNFLAGVA